MDLSSPCPPDDTFFQKVREWYLSLAFIGDLDINLCRDNPTLWESVVMAGSGVFGAAIETGMIMPCFFRYEALSVFYHAVLPALVLTLIFTTVSVRARGRFSVLYVSIATMTWPVSLPLLPWFIPKARAWRREEIVREVMES